MLPTAAGRHCAACATTVTDFTRHTDAELLAHFRRAGAGRVCGRFRAEQLNRPLRAAAVATASRWRARLAAVVALWGLREAAAPAVRAQAPTEQRQPQPPAYLHGSDPAMLRLRGVVVDSVGVGIPGVTVLLDDTQLGTSTDANGRFELSFPAIRWTDGKTEVSFSFVGYTKARLPLVSKPSPEAEPVRIMLQVDRHLRASDTIIVAGGAFYRKPWPWHPRRFWFWLTRPLRG